MAQRALNRAPLSEGDVRALLEAGSSRTLLPAPLLTGGDSDWRAVVYLLRARPGGFAIVCPPDTQVRAALQRFTDDEGEPSVFTAEREVPAETSRRRAIGNIAGLFADLPWSALSGFRRAGGIRLSQGTVTCFVATDGAVVRPVAGGAQDAFTAWLTELEEDDALLEYFTGEELDGEALEEPEEAAADHLLARAAGGSRQSLPASRAARPTLPLRAAHSCSWSWPCSDAVSSSLSGRFGRCRLGAAGALTGPAPPRLGRAEAVPQPGREASSDALAQLAAGAGLEEDELEDLTQHAADPMQRLLATQTLLLQRLAPKAQDPLTTALQGAGGSDSASSGGGVRGHTAREAYLRQLEDHAEVARAIRTNACSELGIPLSSAPPGLLREFLEKRVGLATIAP